ncbi:MAG: DDE-type integrase/transposase/recombinase [Bacteroidetes bacterium]|nr:DDE-type integrase/transposase/recombinase [Bacteroidota bacterium]
MTRNHALAVVNLTKHQYYHKSTGKLSGRKKSTATKLQSNEAYVEVSNESVVTVMQGINADPDTRCGYKRMCTMLMLLGYYINKKKVQRLMRENNMLAPRVKQLGRTYAKFRIVMPKGPLELLEMDIKHVWIESARRSAYILTVIDTFTRVVLSWQVGFTMRSLQVKAVWEHVIMNHLQEHDMLNKKISIEVRNDNGPQFKSIVIQKFFEENYLNQVFTHPYTPQENGHIESFHKILSNALEPSFWSLNELETRLAKFYEGYNKVRVHSSVAGLPPQMFWNAWELGLIERIELPRKRVKFRLKTSYQNLSGIMNQRETSCKNKRAKHTDLTEKSEPEINRPAFDFEPSVY